MKNNIRMIIMGLLFVTHANTFARTSKEVVKHVHKNHVEQDALNQSQSDTQIQAHQKDTSKSRQRMSARKIAGIVVGVVFGVVTIVALTLLGVFFLALHCI
jgi:hypothetical protein